MTIKSGTLTGCPNGGRCGAPRHVFGSAAHLECSRIAARNGHSPAAAVSPAGPPTGLGSARRQFRPEDVIEICAVERVEYTSSFTIEDLEARLGKSLNGGFGGDVQRFVTAVRDHDGALQEELEDDYQNVLEQTWLVTVRDHPHAEAFVSDEEATRGAAMAALAGRDYDQIASEIAAIRSAIESGEDAASVLAKIDALLS